MLPAWSCVRAGYPHDNTGKMPVLRILGYGRRRWDTAQFLKVKLIDASAVGLRNRDDIVVDLDLFALFRQMT